MLYIWVFVGSLSADSTRSGIESRMSASRKTEFLETCSRSHSPGTIRRPRPPDSQFLEPLRPRYPTPMPAQNRTTPGHTRAVRNSRNPVSQFPGGSTAGRIPGFGSGSVREVLGYGFGNRLIVFGFTNVNEEVRG
jgi:hypothetical protein